MDNSEEAGSSVYYNGSEPNVARFFGSIQKSASNSASNIPDVQNTRTSGRKKKLTERAQAFYDEVQSQNKQSKRESLHAEHKSPKSSTIASLKKKNNKCEKLPVVQKPPNTTSSTNSRRKSTPRKIKIEIENVENVKPCFVQLVSLEEPVITSDEVISDTDVYIKKEIEELPDDNIDGFILEEEVDDSPSENNDDYIIFEESSEEEDDDDDDEANNLFYDEDPFQTNKENVDDHNISNEPSSQNKEQETEAVAAVEPTIPPEVHPPNVEGNVSEPSLSQEDQPQSNAEIEQSVSTEAFPENTEESVEEPTAAVEYNPEGEEEEAADDPIYTVESIPNEDEEYNESELKEAFTDEGYAVFVENKEPKRRGRKTSQTKTAFMCPICLTYYKHNKSLCNHMQIHNNVDNPFLCPLCGKGFAQKTNLDIHMKRHNGVKNFQCGICEYRAVCKVEILRHMSKHTGERNYGCEACGKLFTSDCSLRNHVKYVHDRSEKAFCDMCNFTTHSRDIMKRHYITKHTNKEHFECPVCHEIIRAKNSLKVHMRKHTGEKPYHCKECGKSFKSSSQLAAHRRSHRPGEIPCDDCGRLFKTKHHLKRHVIVHSGNKPYVCHLCAYTCNVKGNISKHMKLVHNISSFTFKEPYPTNENGCGNSASLKRGARVTEEILREHTIKGGEVLTIEDLQRQSKEDREWLQEEKLKQLKKIKGKKRKKLDKIPEETDAIYTVVEESSAKQVNNGEQNNVNLEPTSSAHDSTNPDMTGSSDILSDAVQLVNVPTQVENPEETQLEQAEDAASPQYETLSELPVDFGSKVYYIQVVSDSDAAYSGR